MLKAIKNKVCYGSNFLLRNKLRNKIKLFMKN